MIKLLIVLALIIPTSLTAAAQTTKPTTAPSAAATSIININQQLDDRISGANKALVQSTVEANKKRVASLVELQNSAMADKNLDLAVEARDAALRAGTEIEPTTAPAKSKQISDINQRFQIQVSELKKRCSKSVTESKQLRITALKELLNSALQEKNLDLAVAARDEIAKYGTDKSNRSPDGPTTPAVMKIVIAARVDGSEFVSINQRGASWKHGAWGPPEDVTINGVKWDVQKSKDLPNSGSTQFLPFIADFSSARVLSRSGRDVVALERTADGVTVLFADSPEGADNYSITFEVSVATPQTSFAR